MNKVIAGVLAVALLLTGASGAWAKSKEKDKASGKDKQTQSSQGNPDGLSSIGALGVTWE
jgi:hypothetical protein